jgi:hypothetical protein
LQLCGNPAHKVSECNIPSKDIFCDYFGKKGHKKAVCFAKFPKRKELQLPRQILPTSFVAPSTKSQGTLTFHSGFPTKGNSNKNDKEHNDDKKEVFQAHAIQVQTLQNELKSLRAQLANLKGKFSQPASHAQPVQPSRS